MIAYTGIRTSRRRIQQFGQGEKRNQTAPAHLHRREWCFISRSQVVN